MSPSVSHIGHNPCPENTFLAFLNQEMPTHRGRGKLLKRICVLDSQAEHPQLHSGPEERAKHQDLGSEIKAGVENALVGDKIAFNRAEIS